MQLFCNSQYNFNLTKILSQRIEANDEHLMNISNFFFITTWFTFDIIKWMRKRGKMWEVKPKSLQFNSVWDAQKLHVSTAIHNESIFMRKAKISQLYDSVLTVLCARKTQHHPLKSCTHIKFIIIIIIFCNWYFINLITSEC